MSLIVFNAGSSSLKVAFFSDPAAGVRVATARISGFPGAPRMIWSQASETIEQDLSGADHAAAAVACLDIARQRLGDRFSGPSLTAVAHRVVHGGGSAAAATFLDDQTLMDLRALGDIAPLHQATELSVIDAVAAKLPAAVPSIAAYDTAFFAALPAAASTYALPATLRERFGLRKFGFHGSAHRALYEDGCRLAGLDPASARVITLQLGQGCSAAAIAGGRPVDTSMGFTPLAGLVMGTRCGDVDAGLLFHLLRQGQGAEVLESELEHRSGLLGLCGSADMQEILQRSRAGEAAASAAIEVFCLRIRHYIGAYLAALGGGDAIFFGGGIGEHATSIRQRCLQNLEWAGVTTDPSATQGPRLTTASSKIAAYVVPTDEERLIAHEAHALVAAKEKLA